MIKNKLSGKYIIEYSYANGIGTGKDQTLDAINRGVDYLVSVGGEGTTNEVVNAIYEKDVDVSLGFIRAGTANDYLHTIGWPHHILEQIELLKRAETKLVPIIQVIAGEKTKVGLNIADIGIGAKIAHMASIQRKLTQFPGNLRYQLLSLWAVMSWENIASKILIDGFQIDGNLSLLTAGFSYTAGNYKVLPHAKPYGDKLAYTIAMGFNKFDMVKNMQILKKGYHEPTMENIWMGYADEIVIRSQQPILYEIDGEPFAKKSDHIKFSVSARKLRIIKV